MQDPIVIEEKRGKCVCCVYSIFGLWTVCFYVFCGAGSIFCAFFLCCIFVCKLLYSECAAAGGGCALAAAANHGLPTPCCAG